jgi:DNA helicase-2/ATP-dependent DNA helicase PcrA
VDEVLAERERYPLKRRFSFTQLAAFENCPLQYKFAHVYKIPILGSFQKSFGNCIHNTFEDILELHGERGKSTQGGLFDLPQQLPIASGFRVSVDEALSIFETRWAENNNWYPDKATMEKYHSEGRESVKRTMASWQASPPDVAFLERPFEWTIGEHSIRGKVDRIDRLPNGSYGIIDYKTGAPKTEEKIETKDKEQLWIYQCAMEEMGLSVTVLKYVYVLTGDELPIDLVQGAKRDAFRERLGGRMKEILMSRFEASPSPFICRYCDFRNICEHRKL